MNTTVTLSIYNNDGFLARIENDEEMQDIDLAEGDDAAETCADAARVLRVLADRFDRLAEEAKPCHGDTHKRINNPPRKRTALRPNAKVSGPAPEVQNGK